MGHERLSDFILVPATKLRQVISPFRTIERTNAPMCICRSTQAVQGYHLQAQ